MQFLTLETISRRLLWENYHQNHRKQNFKKIVQSHLHIVVAKQKKWFLILLSKKSKKITSPSCSGGHLGPVFKNLEMVHIFFFWTLIIELFMVCGPDRHAAATPFVSLSFARDEANHLLYPIPIALEILLKATHGSRLLHQRQIANCSKTLQGFYALTLDRLCSSKIAATTRYATSGNRRHRC